jgi:hypothetical protein
MVDVGVGGEGSVSSFGSLGSVVSTSPSPSGPPVVSSAGVEEASESERTLRGAVGVPPMKWAWRHERHEGR